jgi:hypothetical protein
MQPLDSLSREFTIIAYDRRESGASGGRVERLSWQLFADSHFADEFQEQDLDRCLGLVAASARALFDRDTPPGAEPEELLAMKAPALIILGDDPAHATSGAHYLRELLPQPEFWTLMPPEQTPERVRDRILEFGRPHR